MSEGSKRDKSLKKAETAAEVERIASRTKLGVSMVAGGAAAVKIAFVVGDLAFFGGLLPIMGAAFACAAGAAYTVFTVLQEKAAKVRRQQVRKYLLLGGERESALQIEA